MRRIFIAINLPENIKNKLQSIQRKWADLPVRFVKKNSLHLTILFIGYVNDEQMLDICRQARKIAKKHQPFELEFNKVCFGPPGKAPRLIWLEGDENKALAELRESLGKILYNEEESRTNFVLQGENRKDLIPHITLARIRQIEWKKMEQEPKIQETVALNISVNSIEVMESNLKRSGAEYAILESAELGKLD